MQCNRGDVSFFLTLSLLHGTVFLDKQEFHLTNDYGFGLLRLGVSVDVLEHNDKLLGALTLGIEVTKEELARRCGLGNVDPQHVRGGGNSSAIEEALCYPLPPAGAMLVTIRPDQDSIGAMAIFYLRAIGKEQTIDKALVVRIGAVDRLGLRGAHDAYASTGGLPGTQREADAIQVIVSSDDPTLTLEDKVVSISQIIAGEMSLQKLQTIAGMKVRSQREFIVVMELGVPLIETRGGYKEARSMINKDYPVGVVIDSAYAGQNGGEYRFTVVRKPGYFDRWGFDAEINAEEAKERGISREELERRMCGWGGNNNIVSSSEGFGCETVLPKERILTLVRNHSRSGIVS